MSCDIRVYPPLIPGDELNHPFTQEDEMTLTAFMGGDMGACIQFTIGGKYCQLSEKRLLDLVEVIHKRIARVDGYNSTGNERKYIRYKGKK